MGDRSAPGGQPGVRSRGQSVRHLQRLARAGSAGLDFPRDARGTREPFVSGIVNPTSMAIGPDGRLYVSSRFEGAVYRVNADGTHERIASDLGVACGLAFDADGSLYVGDRSGTIFRVNDGAAEAFATLPASVAAFHLAISPSASSSSARRRSASYDHVYRIDRRATVARCSRRSAGRRGWRSRPKASSTSSMRWPVAADCTAARSRRRAGAGCDGQRLRRRRVRP